MTKIELTSKLPIEHSQLSISAASAVSPQATTKRPVIDHALTAAEVSKMTGLSTGTLANMRVDGTGPPFIKYGRGPGGAVRYLHSAVVQWRDQQIRKSTSDPGAAPLPP